jgi:hypothetical protein
MADVRQLPLAEYSLQLPSEAGARVGRFVGAAIYVLGALATARFGLLGPSIALGVAGGLLASMRVREDALADGEDGRILLFPDRIEVRGLRTRHEQRGGPPRAYGHAGATTASAARAWRALVFVFLLAPACCRETAPPGAHERRSDVAGWATDTPAGSRPVILSATAVAGGQAEEIVLSNVRVVNALREEYLRNEEISEDALRSYYVDYYLAEVENGGFSQFVYNSEWDPEIVSRVRAGLPAMGAVKHRAWFDARARRVDALGDKGIRAFLDGEYPAERPLAHGPSGAARTVGRRHRGRSRGPWCRAH